MGTKKRPSFEGMRKAARTVQAELREQPQMRIIYIEEKRKKREARTAELARQAKAEEAREAVVA